MNKFEWLEPRQEAQWMQIRINNNNASLTNDPKYAAEAGFSMDIEG